MSQSPDDLGRKISEARKRQGLDTPPEKTVTSGDKGSSSTGKALRASTDLVAALFVGGFLGYWIDQWLDTKPWGMIIFFFLGFGAGFLNIYRSQTGQDYKIGFKEPAKEDKSKDKKE